MHAVWTIMLPCACKIYASTSSKNTYKSLQHIKQKIKTSWCISESGAQIENSVGMIKEWSSLPLNLGLTGFEKVWI